MNSKTVILIAGKIYPEYFNNFLEQYKDIENKIASIWDNEDEFYVNLLILHKFNVIKTNIKFQESYTAQFIPIYNGIKIAKQNGYDIILRTRFDVLSYDYKKYLEKTEYLYRDKITVICGIQTSTIYFLDLITIGPIDKMYLMYLLQYKNDNRYPEQFLMETYSNKTNLKKHDILDIFHFSLDICIENNIEFIWYRPDCWKREGITIPDMKVINEYCKSDFIWK